MRRKEREITDKKVIEDIILKAEVCRIAMVDGQGLPYIVPMNFGYKDNSLYIHCAKDGKKIDILRQNSNVCFEIDVDVEPVVKEPACSSTTYYKSVIGMGIAHFLESHSEKIDGLSVLVKHYKKEDLAEKIPEGILDKMHVIRIDITEITGKANKKML